MKPMISEREQLRRYWLEEAISDEVELIENKPKQKRKYKRAEALFLIRYSFDYNYRHYFDPYENRPMSEFGAELFSFTLADWRKSGKVW